MTKRLKKYRMFPTCLTSKKGFFMCFSKSFLACSRTYKSVKQKESKKKQANNNWARVNALKDTLFRTVVKKKKKVEYPNFMR